MKEWLIFLWRACKIFKVYSLNMCQNLTKMLRWNSRALGTRDTSEPPVSFTPGKTTWEWQEILSQIWEHLFLHCARLAHFNAEILGPRPIYYCWLKTGPSCGWTSQGLQSKRNTNILFSFQTKQWWYVSSFPNYCYFTILSKSKRNLLTSRLVQKVLPCC